MELTNEQRLAICRILIDVMEDVGDVVPATDSRYYDTLCEAASLTAKDWEQAHGMSMLLSLVILKELHYKLKMMLGMTVSDLYSKDQEVLYRHRIAFDILMNSIDWPMSFKGMTS